MDDYDEMKAAAYINCLCVSPNAEPFHFSIASIKRYKTTAKSSQSRFIFHHRVVAVEDRSKKSHLRRNYSKSRVKVRAAREHKR